MSEAALCEQLLAEVRLLNWSRTQQTARTWIEALRSQPAPVWAVERLLQEFPIHSQEGLALMHLAEALLRVPDLETATTLLGDQLSDRFQRLLTRRWLPPDAAESRLNLAQKLGAQGMVLAARRSLQLMGQQFVLGQTIDQALQRAAQMQMDRPLLRMSYDMLGEGARCESHAQNHAAHYTAAIAALAPHARFDGRAPANDGISVKLSALHPRFDALQSGRVMAELLPRVWLLCEQAARANIPLTIDAEESDRLEITLMVFEALASRVAREHLPWTGLGLVIQAYQTRARPAVDAVVGIAREQGIRIMVRLVKGAYWDSEIKRAQELGLEDYPVFTHKQHTDLSYLACATALLAAPDCVYPQFATHNAASVAALLHLCAEAQQPAFELQRLHGMGEGLYREIAHSHPQVPVRMYAPVGEHRDLLAYLVRRLLENGANTSFVHLLADRHVAVDDLLASPLRVQERPALPLPRDIYAPRTNSSGLDLCRSGHRQTLLLALPHAQLQHVANTPLDELADMQARAADAWADWSCTPIADRCAVLQRCAQALEQQMTHFSSLLVREGRKTWGDAVGEVRETVDSLRPFAASQHVDATRSLAANGRRHHRRKQCARARATRRVVVHQPLELSARNLSGASICGLGHRKHRHRQTRRTNTVCGTGRERTSEQLRLARWRFATGLRTR